MARFIFALAAAVALGWCFVTVTNPLEAFQRVAPDWAVWLLLGLGLLGAWRALTRNASSDDL